MEAVQGITQQTNLATLLGLHLFLAMFGAIASNPTYNIPVFLFGIWAYNHNDSATPIRTFTYLLGLSIFLDVVWFSLHGRNSQGESGFVFAMIMNIISLIAKPVSLISAFNTLQSRDGSSGGVWTEAPGAFPGGYEPMP